MNSLNFDEAIIYDKRTYSLYYISLLKIKHIFFFSFFQNGDYNAKIIKMDLFFVSFVIYYSVNAIFFDDNTMHEIYKSKGSFNLEYQLPKIIYSSFISTVLNILFKKLALSNYAIINLKRNINIKLIFYFILSFFCILFFWYYIAMFGAIYRNTQLHLLKDTLISFSISLISPFFIYLLPGFFRIPALANKNKKRICLYNFSKILQIV